MAIPEERQHHKTEVWWLIEAGSPCFYMAPAAYTTTDAWAAHKFSRKDQAEEFLKKHRPQWDQEAGEQDWRILDHLFYM